MITIDGRTYDVHLTKVKLDTEFIYKYANRTEDYGLAYELGAVYFNQTMTFGIGKNATDFSDLWDLLSSSSSVDSGTGHNVQIWTPIGKLTFLMYPNNVSVEMLKESGADTWWSGMQVKFIAVKPSR